MQILLLVHSDPGRWNELPDQGMDADMEAHAALINALSESGSLVAFSPLTPPTEGREVRVRAGRVEVRPNPVTVDPLAGFYLIDVPDLDEAVSVAARIPDANTRHITLRPLLPLAGIIEPDRRSHLAGRRLGEVAIEVDPIREHVPDPGETLVVGECQLPDTTG